MSKKVDQDVVQAKLRRISEQADRIAELIRVDPETVMTDGSYGVALTIEQVDRLLALIPEV